MPPEPCLVCQGLCCGEIPRFNAELERLRGALEEIANNGGVLKSGEWCAELAERVLGLVENAHNSEGDA